MEVRQGPEVLEVVFLVALHHRMIILPVHPLRPLELNRQDIHRVDQVDSKKVQLLAVDILLVDQAVSGLLVVMDIHRVLQVVQVKDLRVAMDIPPAVLVMVDKDPLVVMDIPPGDRVPADRGLQVVMDIHQVDHQVVMYNDLQVGTGILLADQVAVVRDLQVETDIPLEDRMVADKDLREVMDSLLVDLVRVAKDHLHQMRAILVTDHQFHSHSPMKINLKDPAVAQEVDFLQPQVQVDLPSLQLDSFRVVIKDIQVGGLVDPQALHFPVEDKVLLEVIQAEVRDLDLDLKDPQLAVIQVMYDISFL